MGLTLTLTDKGQSAPTSTKKSTLAFLGVSSAGTVNDCKEFSADGLVSNTFGYGPLTEALASTVRIAQVKQVGCKINDSIPGTKTAVAQTGTGPAITLRGTPFDTATPKLKINSAGPLGTATFRLAQDGGTYGPVVSIPLETTAQVTGTIDISALSWPQTGLTLILDADVGAAITYTAVIGETDVATFITNANAAFLAGPSSGRIKLVQGRYIQAYSITPGAASSIQVTSASTLDTVFGLSNLTAAGAAATYVIPKTGVTAMFPTGTYAVNEIYSWSTVEPKFSTTDLVAALTALQNSNLAFRDIVVLSSPIDGPDTRAFADQLVTSMNSWRAGPPKIYSVAMMGSSIGTPSAIATNDTDVKVAMTGHADDYVIAAHGDIYMSGTEIQGSFRRPLVFALAVRAAAYPVSSDPGNREQPRLEECSMIGPDAITLARNEETASVKMEDQGFTTAMSEFGAAYFVSGITRSASAKFKYLGILRMGVQFARVLYAAGRRYQNATRRLAPTGKLREADAKSIEGYVGSQIDLTLSDDISGYKVTVDRTVNVGTTNNLNIAADAQHLGYFFNINLSAGVVDILS